MFVNKINGVIMSIEGILKLVFGIFERVCILGEWEKYIFECCFFIYLFCDLSKCCSFFKF